MTNLPYGDCRFDAVLDVFSSYCLPEIPFQDCLGEIGRVLRPGGKFFSFTPSKRSLAFQDPHPAVRIDGSTLDGIRREISPYFGNIYPFRFISEEEYAGALEERDFRILSCERIGRTYRRGAEYFEFVSLAAEKV